MGALLERGVVLNQPQFLRGKKLVKINSVQKMVQKEACETLRAEFDSLKQKYVDLRNQKQFNFSNTCPLLSRHYKINIVVHQLKHGFDDFCHMESGFGAVYDPSLPRTDIFWAKNDQGVYHAALIKHKPHSYKLR